MKTKNNIWLLLPKNVKEDLDKIEFQLPKHKNKALMFIGYILRENKKDNFDSLKFRTISKKYFVKVYASRYKIEFLDLLVENKILEVNNYFSADKNISKSYRLHQSYFLGSIDYCSTSYSSNSTLPIDSIILSNPSIFDYVTYMWRKNEKHSLKHFKVNFSLTKKAQELGIHSCAFSQMLNKRRKNDLICATYYTELKKENIYNMFDSLTIDYKKILEKTNQVVDAISYNNFKIGAEVEGSYFEVYNRILGTSQWMTKVGASVTAQKFKATLIQDKNKYYIDDLDRYIETKKKNILVSYNTSITALRKRIYSINRNTTNYRLDTVFTSMCSHTLNIIKEDNNLVEIDLVNSQYAIFANWLMTQDCYKKNDVKLFCSLTINGGLYEYINEQLKLENRNQAKKIMMVVAFSSSRYNSNQKTQFKELFPNVYQFISDYNKINNGRFAVCLQNKESAIFIDGLMNILISKGYFVITKHDSLIIKNEDKESVLKIFQDYFEVINFKATVKCGEETITNGVLNIQILPQIQIPVTIIPEKLGAKNEQVLKIENSNEDNEKKIKVMKDNIKKQFALL